MLQRTFAHEKVQEKKTSWTDFYYQIFFDATLYFASYICPNMRPHILVLLLVDANVATYIHHFVWVCYCVSINRSLDGTMPSKS